MSANNPYSEIVDTIRDELSELVPFPGDPDGSVQNSVEGLRDLLEIQALLKYCIRQTRRELWRRVLAGNPVQEPSLLDFINQRRQEEVQP
jgi:hypothetical protein